MTTTKILVGAAVLALLAPSVAQARKSPLAGQPPVRHKQELRMKRMEVAPTFEGTVQGDYKHTLSAGLKAEYHLTDSLSVGALIFFGGGIDTKLTEQIHGSLPPTENNQDPTPSQTTFMERLNTIPFHGGLGATFTPWFGKMALFGKAFVNFDFYVSGGFGFALTSNGMDEDGCAPTDDDPMTDGNQFTNPRNDCAHNSGFNPGLQVGAGLHIYFNKWIALDLSMRDYLFSDNPSGLDFDADLDVDSDDRRFLSHLFFGIGVSMFLPTKAKISR